MDRDETILEYLREKLPPEDRSAFEATMAQDAALAAEVELLRAVRSELATGPKHDNAGAVWDRLAAKMDPLPVHANDNRSPWIHTLRYAAVAVLAVAAWQFTVVPRTGTAPDGFRTSSEVTAAFVLQVKFLDNATIADIGLLLAPANGTIIDGPSALGIVRVSFPDQAARVQALESLGAQSDLVEFVLEQ